MGVCHRDRMGVISTGGENCSDFSLHFYKFGSD